MLLSEMLKRAVVVLLFATAHQRTKQYKLEETCTVWRCKTAPPHNTSSAWIGNVKALHRGFGNSSKIRRLSDPVPLALDLLNPNSTGFDRLSRTTTVISFKSLWAEVFVLSC